MNGFAVALVLLALVGWGCAVAGRPIPWRELVVAVALISLLAFGHWVYQSRLVHSLAPVPAVRSSSGHTGPR